MPRRVNNKRPKAVKLLQKIECGVNTKFSSASSSQTEIKQKDERIYRPLTNTTTRIRNPWISLPVVRSFYLFHSHTNPPPSASLTSIVQFRVASTVTAFPLWTDFHSKTFCLSPFCSYVPRMSSLLFSSHSLVLHGSLDNHRHHRASENRNMVNKYSSNATPFAQPTERRAF